MVYFCSLHIVRNQKKTSFYKKVFHHFPTKKIIVGSCKSDTIFVKELQPQHIDMYFQKDAMILKTKSGVQINTRSMKDAFVSGVMRIPMHSGVLDLFKWQLRVEPHLFISGQIHSENIPSFPLESYLVKKYGQLFKVCEKEYISYRLATKYILQVPSPNYKNGEEQVQVAAWKKKTNSALYPYIKHINEQHKFIISEYFSGITLESYKAQKGCLPINECLSIIKNIAVHLPKVGGASLTPDNLLVNQKSHTKLTGLTQKKQSRYQHYTSPEEAFQRKVPSISGNIYSLGVLLFELATGSSLFSSTDQYQEAVAMNTKDHLDALSHLPNISQKARDLIVQMLVFSPQKRISHTCLLKAL